MTKLTAWGVFKKVLAFSLEILDHMIKAGGPTMKPGAEKIYGRYNDGEIGPLECNRQLRELKIK